MTTISLSPAKKIYFSSDNHLGSPNREISLKREKIFISWLDKIKSDAQAIFFLGDLFDFWFEYKTVVPKGFTRLFGKLAELSDSGIDLFFFVGNHDCPGDIKYKFLKFLFRSSILRKLFSFIHPDIGISLGRFFSDNNKILSGNNSPFESKEKEMLYTYCKNVLKTKHYDYFIFGHRHLPLELDLGNNSKYFNTGDWISHFSYLVYDGTSFTLNYNNK